MYTLNEAARIVGKSKSTVLRWVKSGRISATRDEDGTYRIDPSELNRVHPNGSPDAVHGRSNEAPRTTHDGAGEAAHLALKLEMAEKERVAAEALAQERERQIHQHEKTIDDLRKRLDIEGEERRNLSAMLTDLRDKEPEKPKGFWRRLIGG